MVKSEKENPDADASGLGATDPIRTDDLLITSELLYLLSHSSVWNRHSIASLSRPVKRFLDFVSENTAKNTLKKSKLILDKGDWLCYHCCCSIWESSRVAKGDRL